MMKRLEHYSCLKSKEFHHKDYSICSIREQDIMSIRVWRNLQIDVLRQKSLISEEQQKRYFDSVIWPTFEQDNPNQILVSFFKHGELIGYGGLVHISWEDKRAEVSFLVDPERHIPEIYEEDFSAFLTLVGSMAFSDLGFYRIFTETYDIRELHISILEKNNFQREGIMRKHVLIHGERIDSIIHGCINE